MDLLGRTIRNFRIVDTLGKGGMGDVYVGFDEKLKRKVALKVLRGEFRLDREAKGRLLREAQTLSQLEHPNICRIYDLIEGEESDLLVLELIDGKTLKAAMKEGFPAQEKLRIALEIVRVLVAAHGKSIIHRDLKPDNVMITPEGIVKILDFGLARTLAEEQTTTLDMPEETSGIGTAPPQSSQAAVPGEGITRAGTVTGTLGYMSPEQARGESFTAASDMYSFGLVLQELMTGKPAMDRSLPAAERLRRASRGESVPVEGLGPELTLLINRLKSFDPATRPTAVDTAENLHAISEKPRRRRRRIAFTALVVLLAAVAAAMALMAYRIHREAERANREAEAARQVSEFLVNLFEVSDPGEARGNTVTAREILDQGAAKISRELEDQPVTRARLMDTMGIVYQKLGLFDQAVPLLEEALRLRREELGPDHPDVAASLRNAALVDWDRGNFEEAEARFLEALAIFEKACGGEDIRVADCLNVLAGLYWSQGRYADAETFCRRSLEVREKVLGENDPQVAKSLTNLAILCDQDGKADQAETLLWRALSIQEKAFGEDHPEVAVTLNNLGALFEDQGRYTQAEPLYRRALSIWQKALGEEHPNVAACMGNLAEVYRGEGRLEEAAELYGRQLAIQEKILGRDHPFVAYALMGLGDVRSDEGNLEEAETLYRRALDIREKALEPGHEDLAESTRRLAGLLRRTGREAEAAELEARIPDAPPES